MLRVAGDRVRFSADRPVIEVNENYIREAEHRSQLGEAYVLKPRAAMAYATGPWHYI